MAISQDKELKNDLARYVDDDDGSLQIMPEMVAGANNQVNGLFLTNEMAS